MARRGKRDSSRSEEFASLPPAISSEERERQLINMAMDAAEKQMRTNTASSQVITHFLKLGTEREKLEREKLAHETAMLEAKTKQIQASEEMDKLYTQAIEAFRSYHSGSGDEEEDYEA